jgi:hypothetical protein
VYTLRALEGPTVCVEMIGGGLSALIVCLYDQ